MENIKKRNFIIFLSLIILFSTIIGLGLYGYFKVLNTDLIYEGVKVEEFDLSFMTKEEALKLIKDAKEIELEKSNMELSYIDRNYTIHLKELDFNFDYNKAIDEAYSIGREGNIIERIKDIIKTKKEGIIFTLDSNFNKEKTNNIVDMIAEDIDIDVKDAGFNFNNGNITVTEEVVGKNVNKIELVKAINNNVYTLDKIEIPVESVIPKKSKDLLGRINGIIGEFSTSFSGSSGNRIENIRLSSGAIKGKMLMPGESMSFNETTGPRESQFGYKEAIVIIEGEFTPDIGGGVCQSSTTFYNALLLADLTITQRSAHSIPAKYVKFGQDAAVAYGYLDLKLRNDFDYPVYFDSKIIGDRVHFYVYGDKNAKDYNVRIEPETVETIVAKEETILDKTLEPGTKELVQQGRTGYRVNTYKSIIKNGKVVSRNLITKDYYRAKNFIYKIGEEPETITTINPNEEIDINEDDNPNIDEDVEED